jgi:hypothetical protein
MPNNPPQTSVRTSHAITIKTSGGVTIGMIKTWNPTVSRDITPIYELNVETSGDPVENVPGNVKSLTIKVNRYDLYTKRMEEAFGSVSVNWLSDADRPFAVLEHWRLPDGGIEIWQYSGCWFNQIGRNYQSEDQRLVMVDAGITYLKRSKIQ